METLVKERGPMTAYSLGRIMKMKRSAVNAILHANRHFVKTERSPLSNVTARPVWTWSDKVVPLPVRRTIDSRNKEARRRARAEAEEKST